MRAICPAAAFVILLGGCQAPSDVDHHAAQTSCAVLGKAIRDQRVHVTIYGEVGIHVTVPACNNVEMALIFLREDEQHKFNALKSQAKKNMSDVSFDANAKGNVIEDTDGALMFVVTSELEDVSNVTEQDAYKPQK